MEKVGRLTQPSMNNVWWRSGNKRFLSSKLTFFKLSNDSSVVYGYSSSITIRFFMCKIRPGHMLWGNVLRTRDWFGLQDKYVHCT